MALQATTKMSNPTLPNYESLEALAKGEIQFGRLKTELDDSHSGKAVAIEPTSEDYFLGEDYADVVAKAREQYPDQTLFCAMLGTRESKTLKDRARPIGQCYDPALPRYKR